MRILQIGCGAFGGQHLAAWRRLGRLDDIVVADPLAAARAVAESLGAKAVSDWEGRLEHVDAVSILAPTDRHAEILHRVVPARRPIFVEKPMTATAREAEEIRRLVREHGTPVQVGMYFRCHPKAVWLREQIRSGALGRVRYLRGDFSGFKRARPDSGALENDAVHFLDLFAWLLGENPRRVQALARDHFGRGREDLAIVLLDYPGGAAAKIEVGYVQPGRAPDTIVPGALTTKEIAVCGEAGTVEIDFQAETMRRYDLTFSEIDGRWTPRFAACAPPAIPSAGPVEIVAAELSAFLDIVQHGGAPLAGIDDGVALARTVDAAKLAAREARAIDIG